MTVLRRAVSGAGVLTLDRPDQMNAITTELAGELEGAINDLGADPAVNVIVIRGAGGNFCAGGDFAEVERLRAEGADALAALFSAFRRACDAIARVDVPVVAAVEGIAMAGGFELMQAADIVLISERAKVSDNHINFGMIPGGGSTARLARLIGRQQALGLLLSGDRLTGTEAVARGLAYRAYPADEFDESVHAFVETLAARSRVATTTIKRLVRSGLDSPLGAALDAEAHAVVSHICGESGRTAIDRFEHRQTKEVRA